jgi:hypothetical protein
LGVVAGAGELKRGAVVRCREVLVDDEVCPAAGLDGVNCTGSMQLWPGSSGWAQLLLAVKSPLFGPGFPRE